MAQHAKKKFDLPQICLGEGDNQKHLRPLLLWTRLGIITVPCLRLGLMLNAFGVLGLALV